MGKLNREQIIKTLSDALKLSHGSGHHLQYGKPPRRRFDPDTGQEYWTDTTPALLECSDAKMRAIWSVWEQVEPILFELEAAGRAALKEQAR